MDFQCFTGQAKASSQGPTCVDVTFISCHQNISEFFKGSGIRSTGFKSMGERWSALNQGTSLHQSGVNVISAIISCQPYITTCCFAAWNLAINNMWPSGATKKEIRSVSTYLSQSKSHSVFALMHHSPNADVGIRSSFFPEVVHLSFLGFVWSFILMQKVMKLWLPPKNHANFSYWVYPQSSGKMANAQACFLCGAPDHELPSCLEARWEKSTFLDGSVEKILAKWPEINTFSGSS